MEKHQDHNRSYSKFIYDLTNKHPCISEQEKDILLSFQMGALPTPGLLPTDKDELEQFRVAQRCLFRIRKGRENISPDGILFRGRPDFLSPDFLDDLRNEQVQQTPLTNPNRWGQKVIPAGPKANKFATSKELRHLVQSFSGALKKQNTRSYLSYEERGDFVPVHLDNPNYGVNVLLMLQHRALPEKQSTLYVYPVDQDPRAIQLDPGELLIFYADTFAHGRSAVNFNECVRLLSIGFGLKE